MSSPLDNSLCTELGKCVETLTHTGQKVLDKDILKKLKNICKISDGYVEHAYHVLIYQLEKGHAEIRFSAFQICDELFRRSHCFRELLVSNLQHVMELTCETNSDCHLPPPRSVALSLKRMALQSIQEWNKVYGDGYKKLQLGYNFLRHCKKVDFSALQMENSAEQARRGEQERRQKAVNQEKLKKVTTEINEMQPEITSTLTTLENCINLLLPTPEDFFIQEENGKETKSKETGDNDIVKQMGNKVNEDTQSDSEKDCEPNRATDEKELHLPSTSKHEVEDSGSQVENSDFESGTSDSEEEEEEEDDINFRQYGMLSSKYSIEVNVNTDSTTVKETAENADIFDNARDMYKLINNRFLPTVKTWIKIITKASDSSDQLKKIIDLKDSLEKASKKYLLLRQHTVAQDASDTSDSDFEEVKEKEGYENTPVADTPIPAPSTEKVHGTQKQSTKTGWNIWSEENNEKDPTSAQSTLSSLKTTKSVPKPPEIISKTESASKNKTSHKTTKPEEEPIPSTSKGSSKMDRKAKLLAVAPKVPFDIDLYHWEDENVATPTMMAVRAEGSRFWYTSLEELEEVPVPEGLSGIRTRVIEFTGKFEPVEWACRAPLPSGKLCPRKDRYKCPFHGPIIARDKTGQCSNPEDAQKVVREAENKQQQCPDWQDPQLLEDLKQATGVDLKMPEKRNGRGRKKKKKSDKDKYPGLTDIRAKQNTPFTRLSKKIFKRGAMKRVATALDAADHKRFRDKYGDQFHYMYNTS
ncbi:UV-stimulated scaffold protein A-like [Periplaneta americana]|uniref:UV-stimulated scaffold protein A-like n=1 Tax=Periplaneta americana TaxID=6978 RepID=UPI0037E8E23F